MWGVVCLGARGEDLLSFNRYPVLYFNKSKDYLSVGLFTKCISESSGRTFLKP